MRSFMTEHVCELVVIFGAAQESLSDVDVASGGRESIGLVAFDDDEADLEPMPSRRRRNAVADAAQDAIVGRLVEDESFAAHVVEDLLSDLTLLRGIGGEGNTGQRAAASG